MLGQRVIVNIAWLCSVKAVSGLVWDRTALIFEYYGEMSFSTDFLLLFSWSDAVPSDLV